MASKSQRKFRRNDHPSSFVCPMTYKITTAPVQDACGHNFEEKAIRNWLDQGHCFCPISRKDMSVGDLKSNDALAEQIERWQWRRDNETELRILCSATGGDKKGFHTFMKACAKQGDIETGGLLPSTEQVFEDEMILLPQERKVLQFVHHQQLEQHQQKRRRCAVRSIVMFLLLNGFMAAILFIWIQFQLSEDSEARDVVPDTDHN
eukprot:CAMPEP_0172459770 /NCGR_PEP_ID=MMETSP1065-20121228/34099_1 /TAXON_ID=265537 /ORGANISM="Amphiprora paludosa, Strain CCMP125" /LENGTH=205 /DNA_ID=CAMNT_0013214593 /DNA_START=15 /DNA_END=632 /DNA_ORIENTATION=+